MPYTPNNPAIFIAALSGSIAGMGVSHKQIVSQNPPDYNEIVEVAGAFAQRLDSQIPATSAEIPEGLSIALEHCCQAAWHERTPSPIQNSFKTPSTYDYITKPLIAITQSLLSYYNTNNIPTNPNNSNALTQAIWYINSATGNDNRTGKTSAQALKTEKELQRRWGCCAILNPAGNDVTVNMSGLPSTDTVNFDINLAPGKNLYFKSTGVVNLHSGTVTAQTSLNRAVNQQWEFTDAALPTADFWSGMLGKRVRLTSGANAGAIAYILSDLNYTQVIQGSGGFSAGGHTTGFVGGETLDVKLGTGPIQTVTFAATDQTTFDVRDAINAQLAAGWSVCLAGGDSATPTATTPDPQIFLRTENSYYTNGAFDPITERILVTGGTGLAALGLTITVVQPKTARVTEWALQVGADGFNEAGHNPAPGDSYVVEELPTIYTGEMVYGCQGVVDQPDTGVPGVFLSDFTITTVNGAPASLPTSRGGNQFVQSAFINCQLVSGAFLSGTFSTGSHLYNCLSISAVVPSGLGLGPCLLLAGGILALGGETHIEANGPVGIDNNYVCQGAGILCLNKATFILAGGTGFFQKNDSLIVVAGGSVRYTDFFISFSTSLYGKDYTNPAILMTEESSSFKYDIYPAFGSGGIAPSADGENVGGAQIGVTFIDPQPITTPNQGWEQPGFDFATNAYTTSRATTWANIATPIGAGGFVQDSAGGETFATVCIPSQAAVANFQTVV